ncbi:MAG: hypothetical protein KAY24_15685 [Candidatus Eisenbacteria sp.]|nr:hypothetical protein [Candidatus Eisenbacteria bacterium]
MTGGLRTPAAYLLGLFAAAILAIAAFHKAADPGLFVDQITAHKVTPAAWSPAIAYFFVAAELLIAAAFVAFIWPRLVFAGTILMMLGFIGVTAWAWAHGNAETCGCFGRLVDRGPQEVIIEDSVVIVTSLLGLYLARGFRTRRRQWALAIPLMAVALALTIFGAAMPVDGIVVGIGPGHDLSDMALQGVRIPLDEGWILLAIIGPDCPKCDQGVASLKQVVTRKMGPKVVAAYPGTSGEAQAWRMKHLPSFPVASSPERILRQYYRQVPATFMMEDGIVRKVWWNEIPTPEQVAEALSSNSG